MAFSGISCFNSGVRTFSFPGPECTDYPQDEKKDDDGFLKDWITHKMSLRPARGYKQDG